MDLSSALLRLLDAEDPWNRIVTLTLDVSGSGILSPEAEMFLSDRVVKHLMAEDCDGPDRGKWGAVVRRISDFVRSRLNPKADGLYLAAGEHLFEAIELGIPLRNFMHVGRTAYLPPLLEARARYPRALAVRCDERGAEVFELELGELTPLARISTIAPGIDIERAISGRVAGAGRRSGAGQGGSRRDRFDQTADEAVSAMLRKVARRVQRADASNSNALLVAADRRHFARLRNLLPPALRSGVHHLGKLDADGPAFQRRVAGELDRLTREESAAEYLRFHDRRVEGNQVALGPEAVLEALRTGQLDRVYLNSDDPVPGLRCLECGFMAPGLSERCRFCGGSLVPISLTQEMAAFSVLHPPLPITFVGPQERWLGDLGGMAALISAKGIRRSRP